MGGVGHQVGHGLAVRLLWHGEGGMARAYWRHTIKGLHPAYPCLGHNLLDCIPVDYDKWSLDISCMHSLPTLPLHSANPLSRMRRCGSSIGQLAWCRLCRRLGFGRRLSNLVDLHVGCRSNIGHNIAAVWIGTLEVSQVDRDGLALWWGLRRWVVGSGSAVPGCGLWTWGLG